MTVQIVGLQIKFFIIHIAWQSYLKAKEAMTLSLLPKIGGIHI